MHKVSDEKLRISLSPERPEKDAVNRLVLAGGNDKDWGPDADWGSILEDEGILQSELLISAFKRARRCEFLRSRRVQYAGYNYSAPIGYGSYNSKPSLVGVMLEELQLRRGQRLLDVGAGSAWTTAIMADVTGRVIGTEVVPEIVDFGNGNLEKFKQSYDVHPPDAHIEYTPVTFGYPAGSPYDRILVSARLREDWIEELATQLHPEGGIMVAPVCSVDDFYDNERCTQELVVFTRNGFNVIGKAVMDDISFVPIVRS